MIKMIATMQFKMCWKIFEIIDIKLEHDQMDWNYEIMKLSLFMQLL